MKLSAIIIAKNSEKLIEECIRSVSFCSEVIVVDNGSTDNTVEVSKKLGAKVLRNPGDNFATQRNVGLAFASGEWVFYIDTDERVTDELRKNILNVISSATRRRFDEASALGVNPNEISRNVEDDKIEIFKIQRRNFYLGNHEWPQIEYLERLFKKKSLKEWSGKLHESPIFNGEVSTLDGYLDHFTHRDLSSMLNKTIVWSDIEAELRFKTHHPKIVLWRFIRVMLTGFWEYYIKQGGYKVGTAGLIESVYQSFSMFITYAKLWELQQPNKN